MLKQTSVGVEVVVVEDVDGADKRPLGGKGVADGLSDTSRSAGDYRNFRFIHVIAPFFEGPGCVGLRQIFK